MRQRCAKRSGASSSRVAGGARPGFEFVSIGGCLAWSCALVCLNVRSLGLLLYKFKLVPKALFSADDFNLLRPVNNTSSHNNPDGP